LEPVGLVSIGLTSFASIHFLRLAVVGMEDCPNRLLELERVTFAKVPGLIDDCVSLGLPVGLMGEFFTMSGAARSTLDLTVPIMENLSEGSQDEFLQELMLANVFVARRLLTSGLTSSASLATHVETSFGKPRQPAGKIRPGEGYLCLPLLVTYSVSFGIDRYTTSQSFLERYR
jgi:hypothetical protein